VWARIAASWPRQRFGTAGSCVASSLNTRAALSFHADASHWVRYRIAMPEAEPALEALYPWAIRVVRFEDDGSLPGLTEDRWAPPRSHWGDGPWQTEPDLVEWRFSGAPGYPLLILRGGMGQLNGYVGVPPGHPLHGGRRGFPGVNWDGRCEGLRIPTGDPPVCWWLGFDCGHAHQYSPAMVGLGSFLARLTGRAAPRPVGEPHEYVDLESCRARVEALAVLLHEADTEEKLAAFLEAQGRAFLEMLAKLRSSVQ
jgi:hypothetical protein